MRPPHRSPRPCGGALLAAAALLSFPAAAPAALQTFGSDLALPADESQAFGADVAYWQTSFADRRLPTVPVDGQIREIRLKGFAHSDREDGATSGGGERMFHVQALTREGGTVRARITSQAFDVASRSVADEATVTAYRPENFCVKAGELIAFNNIGGFHPQTFPQGTPMQIFAKVPGAVVDYFTADNGTNNGDLFTPRPGHPHDKRGRLAGTELLMQMTLATGDDRSYECGGPNTYRPADRVPTGSRSVSRPVSPPAAPTPQAVTIPNGRIGVARSGTATVGLRCQSGPARCKGLVSVTGRDRRRGKTVKLASASYDLIAGRTASVRLRLTRSGFRAFKRNRRRMAGTVVTVTQPGGPAMTQRRAIKIKPRGA
ncbi:MAG: hypothetical protein M3P50_03210 [Actinomycetota bacterium]|nr:hypothetical protein [Actinomycetota bacterium]